MVSVYLDDEAHLFRSNRGGALKTECARSLVLKTAGNLVKKKSHPQHESVLHTLSTTQMSLAICIEQDAHLVILETRALPSGCV